MGSTLTGAGVYYYVLEEYKVSNELLTEDIYVSTTLRQESGVGGGEAWDRIGEIAVRGCCDRLC